MENVKVTLVKSLIACKKAQIATAKSLGLNKIGDFIVHNDDAVLAGMPTIRIIHGKGTGALRAAVHAHLKGHKQVKGFRLGVYGEGETGVTIVEIK